MRVSASSFGFSSRVRKYAPRHARSSVLIVKATGWSHLCRRMIVGASFLKVTCRFEKWTGHLLGFACGWLSIVGMFTWEASQLF